MEPMTETKLTKLLRSKITLSVLIFLLALLPRLPELGRFLTPDEFLWVDRSRNFLAGLTNPNYECDPALDEWQPETGLGCTVRTGHPGVTTMWSGSLGFWLRWLSEGRPGPLHDYTVAVSTNPLDPDFIAPTRLGTVFITALAMVAIYWLTRRLFGHPIALVGAALLALDPFHIGLSRVIHHDAYSTTFMTLSVLSAFIYWGQRAGRRWLLLSGAMAGLGILSKSPALYLLPFTGVVGWWFFFAHRPATPLARLILDGLLWFAAAMAVVFIFWPGMWVIPLKAIQIVVFIGSKYATGGHAKGTYFLGQVSRDPGPLFYPVTWLYRATPLVLLGIIAAPITWLLARRRSHPPEKEATGLDWSAFRRYLPLIGLFILGYYLFMTIGEKKQDRYFLPVYPWLNLVGAAGLLYTTAYLLKGRLARHSTTLVLLAVLVVNGSLAAYNFPYYFTYYNPLLGGIQSAAKNLTVGWGEGMDLVAEYLNQKEDPANTRVSLWYESTFAPYYRGRPSVTPRKKARPWPGITLSFTSTSFSANFPTRFYLTTLRNAFPWKKPSPCTG